MKLNNHLDDRETYLDRTILQDCSARKQHLLVSAGEKEIPPCTVVCNRERDMTTLRSHSKDGELLNSLCVRGSSCDVRFCVAVMVGWLEWGLLVRIGLGVGGEVNRRGSIASMTRSARIGEGGRINFHFHTSRWVVGTRVWVREYRRVLNDGLVSATLGLFVFDEARR